MSLLSLRNISFTWTGEPLLDDVTVEIERGERIGLLGRNGAGKSTFMKIIDGEVAPDDGAVVRDPKLIVSRLIQEVPQDTTGTVAEIVAQSVVSHDDESLEWQSEQAVKRVLSRVKLDGELRFENLSSGMKRRVLLAQALVNDPDILLLDEPTNHLDIQSISWLEGFLKNYDGTLIFVTHDRVFLQALSTRIIEIDRGNLFDWTCNYSTFLQRKQAALEAEEKQNELFDKKLAKEEVWIRQGIKARRTRNEGRVRALKKMREERRSRREQLGNVRMQATEAEKSGRLVVEATDIAFAYDDTPIVDSFSTLISRGEKIGIIGPNGAGKTTLLKILLGDLEPQSGKIRHGTKLQVIYFDQLREQIDEEKTVAENVGDGREMLEINGRKQHIYGYLQDFLFTPERARRPARYLSGGERNRLMLARIFQQPCNVMVLDEPTNDLDAETLELLEELVTNFEGTLLLVSHDRAFLNNVVTSTFAFEGNGAVKEYDGGYDDYVRASSQNANQEASGKAKKQAAKKAKESDGKKKLTYKEQRELESLPDDIADLETQQTAIHDKMADPDFFKQDGEAISVANVELQQIELKLEELMLRWEELESRA